MVAGAVGIDLVVLVVAADEASCHRRREHLDICGLLGITRGVVALSKSDLVDGEAPRLALADVANAAGHVPRRAPICGVGQDGEGLDALKRDRGRLTRGAGKDPEGRCASDRSRLLD